MWEVIRDQVREGTTLLLTTQYLEEADELADEIAVVDHGRIIARGTSDELKPRSAASVSRSSSGTATTCARAAAVLAPDGGGVGRQHTRRVTVAARGGAQQLVDVVRRLGEAAIRGRRRRPPPADARRRVPHAHRSCRRGARPSGGEDEPDEELAA